MLPLQKLNGSIICGWKASTDRKLVRQFQKVAASEVAEEQKREETKRRKRRSLFGEAEPPQAPRRPSFLLFENFEWSADVDNVSSR